MTKRKVFEYGGYAASVLLIAFGIGALWLSFDARSTVGDELKREQIVGSEDMSPSAIQAGIDEAGLTGVTAPSCDVADQPIETGSDARCFSQYMRIHALESSGGLTYAQMGRFLAADDPENPAGTSDEAAALTDDEGNPGPEPGPEHLGNRDLAVHGAQPLVPGRAARALRNRRRDRADPDRHRVLRARTRRRSSPLGGRRLGCQEGGYRLAAPFPDKSAGSPVPPPAARRSFRRG